MHSDALNFSFGNLRIDQRHSGIEFDVLMELRGHVVFMKNRFDRALGHTGFAVDTIFWMDEQHLRALVKAIAGASRYAGRVFATDALFGDDKSHDDLSGEQKCVKAVK